MKVPITLHRLENPYNAPPPIAITGNRLTRATSVRTLLTTSLNRGATPTIGMDGKPAWGYAYWGEPCLVQLVVGAFN